MMVILERPRAVLEHQPEANHYDTLERDRMAAQQSTQNTPERWLPVPGYEGMYEVSSVGRVRSLPRIVHRKDGRSRRALGGDLNRRVSGTGYLCVDLWKENQGSRENVHVLVAAAFIGPRPDGMFVCHYNDVKTDNRVENLRYATPADNEADKRRNGRNFNLAQERGKKCGHLLAEPNLVPSKLKHGVRQCLSCARAQAHCYYRNITDREVRMKVADSYYESIMGGVSA